MQRRAGVGPHVGAEVHRAPLAPGVAGRRELGRGVEQPGLAVPADRHGVRVAVDVAADQPVEALRTRAGVGRADQVAADGQIEREGPQLRPRDAEQGRGLRGGEVGAHLGSRRVRLEAARGAQAVEREPRAHRYEQRQRAPGRVLVDGEVGVVRALRALHGRMHPAEREPGEHEVPQHVELGLGQRVLGVEAGGDVGERADRIAARQDVVRRRHGHLGDDHRVHQVAEVDEPDDAREALGRRVRRAAVDQDVVVVGVAVDHRVRQSRQSRLDVAREPGGDLVEERAPGGVGDGVAVTGDDLAGAHDVPVEVAVGVRMVEPLERVGEPPEHRAQVAPQRRRRGCRVRHQRPRQVLEQAHEVAVDLGDLRAVARPAYRLDGQAGRGRARRDLELGVEDVARLEGVGHLEHPARAVRRGDPEDPVALAGEVGGRPLDPVDLEDDPLGLGGGRQGRVVEQRHAPHPRRSEP